MVSKEEYARVKLINKLLYLDFALILKQNLEDILANKIFFWLHFNGIP